VKNAEKDYSVVSYDEGTAYFEPLPLPNNLCVHTVDMPNFIRNDTVLFLSEEKIVKAYNITNGNEEFTFTNCDFPGST
jgi:hypothetical protein